MATATDADRLGSIAPEAAIGQVHLNVRDLQRSRDFYERLIGLQASPGPDGSLTFAPARWPALLTLHGNPSAPLRNPRQTGLYHLAILLPSRRDLAVALVRLAQGGWRLSGASDHIASEALYLNDPDGNGLEIYRDRDRSTWTYDTEGRILMGTLALDIDDLLLELRDVPPDPEVDALMPSGTRIGHVHLQVSEIPSARRFYNGVLGFGNPVPDLPGALFVSAGGYHHHVGMNTWHSRRGSTPPPDGVGLVSYELKLGDPGALDALLARVSDAGIQTTSLGDGVELVRDPSGNAILLTV